MNEDIIKKIKNYPIDIDGQTREHIRQRTNYY